MRSATATPYPPPSPSSSPSSFSSSSSFSSGASSASASSRSSFSARSSFTPAEMAATCREREDLRHQLIKMEARWKAADAKFHEYKNKFKDLQTMSNQTQELVQKERDKLAMELDEAQERISVLQREKGALTAQLAASASASSPSVPPLSPASSLHESPSDTLARVQRDPRLKGLMAEALNQMAAKAAADQEKLAEQLKQRWDEAMQKHEQQVKELQAQLNAVQTPPHEVETLRSQLQEAQTCVANLQKQAHTDALEREQERKDAREHREGMQRMQEELQRRLEEAMAQVSQLKGQGVTHGTDARSTQTSVQAVAHPAAGTLARQSSVETLSAGASSSAAGAVVAGASSLPQLVPTSAPSPLPPSPALDKENRSGSTTAPSPLIIPPAAGSSGVLKLPVALAEMKSWPKAQLPGKRRKVAAAGEANQTGTNGTVAASPASTAPSTPLASQLPPVAPPHPTLHAASPVVSPSPLTFSAPPSLLVPASGTSSPQSQACSAAATPSSVGGSMFAAALPPAGASFAYPAISSTAATATALEHAAAASAPVPPPSGPVLPRSTKLKLPAKRRLKTMDAAETMSNGSVASSTAQVVPVQSASVSMTD